MSKRFHVEVFRFGNVARDVFEEICLYVNDPYTIISLLFTNKHFKEIVSSPNFYGSQNATFPVGLNTATEEDFPDDISLAEMCKHSNIIEKRETEGKKRFGMMYYEVYTRSDPINYVYNIKTEESGVFFKDDALEKLFLLFPKLRGLGISHMPCITDSPFSVFELKKMKLKHLDICGCKRISEKILLKPGFVNNLEVLEISDMLSKLKKKKMKIEFKKLRKLVVKAEFEGCSGWTKPEVDGSVFNELISSKDLREIRFYHVSFNNSIPFDPMDKEPFFLEKIQNLKVLKVIGWDYSQEIFSRLSNLEELDVDVYNKNDDQFRFLVGLKKLKLGGGVTCKITRKIFQTMPKLEHLDISQFNGIYLYEYDKSKNSFSKEDIDLFSKLKVFHMCCKGTKNYFTEYIERKKELYCQCYEYIVGKKLQDHQFEKNTQRYIHFFCQHCKECQRGCSKKMPCPKMSLDECYECKKMVCCTMGCEKCDRNFCPCTRVHLRWGFCRDCEYEKLCSNCLEQNVSCDQCEYSICQACSSVCVECEECLCTECNKHYDEESDTLIELENRVCNNCK